MNAAADQTGPIAVYGATGYTGRLVAAELERRGADFVLAGRDAGKLRRLAEELRAGARTQAVALADADGLRDLLAPCAAVIACAGPFVRHGEPVLAAAIDAGTHYLDTTGELGFMRSVFDRGRRAEERGVALVTAMGFDYVPGDLIASFVAEGMGPLDEIVIAYAVRGFSPTRGTASSGLGVIADSEIAVHGSYEFPPPVGSQRVISFPAGERITVPRHVETRQVTTLMSGMMLPAGLARVAPVAIPAMRAALRPAAARRLADRVIKRLPEGPGESARKRATFTVAAEARSGSRRRRGSLSGRDLYGLTAHSVVAGALLAAAPGFAGRGALAPAEAFGAEQLFDHLADFGVSRQVEPLPA